MADNTQTHHLVKGAILLSLAGLFSKVLSAGYRIPLQNIAGDLGFYIYQQVYPILGMALTLSLYGFPVAISKLVSEIEEEGQRLSLKSFYIPALTWLLGICLSVFALGYVQAGNIAAVMGDPKLTPSIRAAFFAFLLLPFTSLIRGIYQGQNNMQPTAVSQVIEQVLRVALIIATAVYAVTSGHIYQIGIGASAAAVLGSIGAAVFLGYSARKDHLWSCSPWSNFSVSFPKTILFYGLFICLNYMLLLLFQMVDSLTLVPQLTHTGISDVKAKVLKGVFDRGQPLVQLGTVLASSIALALIPSVTKRKFAEHKEEVQRYIFSAVKFSLLLALGATIGLITLFPEVNTLFFQDNKGTGALRLLMSVILFSSLAITLSSVLQGLGRVTHTAVLVLVGVFLKSIGNVFLIPHFGLYGAALSTVVAMVAVMAGNFFWLARYFPLTKWRTFPWSAAILAAAGMAAVLQAVRQLEAYVPVGEDRIILLIFTLALVALGAFIYVVLLLTFGALTERELEPLPKSRIWIRLLPKGRKT
ncbi:polysaccharide biosynthesis protein [Halobacillus salinarum]|uniref:Polysaccharide biosynthesis protein n=1 Tax=Halobacillus salinarum TaxID=2932257 RepID=A0ABY4EKQ1_9BACI|nr:polysaccharide biosynthesis protein [Halobacillus salinarum]UOQ44668.1 polysaccharide biosynthesis protein [Halobacillus salinarum]